MRKNRVRDSFKTLRTLRLFIGHSDSSLRFLQAAAAATAIAAQETMNPTMIGAREPRPPVIGRELTDMTHCAYSVRVPSMMVMLAPGW